VDSFPTDAVVTALLVAAAVWLSLRLMVMAPGILRHHAQPMDWSTLERSGKPNDYLLMPGPDADGAPAHFDQPAPALAQALRQTLKQMPRTRILAESQDGLRLEAVQRSLLIGFPDFISLRIEPTTSTAGENGAALWCYSRAHFGYSDLGVNKKRVLRLVQTAAEKLRGSG